MDSQQGFDAVIRKYSEPVNRSSLRRSWRVWAEELRRRHLDGVAVAILEAGGPLVLVSSQLLHVGRPLLGEVATKLAMLLESELETAAFRDYLVAQRGETESAQEGDA